MTAAEIPDNELYRLAVAATTKTQEVFRSRPGQRLMGYVGAALVTEAGNVYTGVVLNLEVGIGFCAESSAVSAMVGQGETRIARMCAATADGQVLPPCGRCRELLYQIDPANLDTGIATPDGVRPLRTLLPDPWQTYWDQPLA